MTSMICADAHSICKESFLGHRTQPIYERAQVPDQYVQHGSKENSERYSSDDRPAGHLDGRRFALWLNLGQCSRPAL